MARRMTAALALGAAMLAPGGAAAETLTVTGEFPAPFREASFLESLTVERISGQDGHALELAIERALSGLPNTELLAGRAGRANAEGSLSGTVTTGVEETGFKKKEKKCVARDDKDKCTKEEEVEVNCRRRVINVNADLRIVRNSDGRIVYSAAKPFRDETSWCAGQNASRTVEDTVSGAINGIAGSIRGEISPSIETYRIRVRESTKGMAKDVAKQFKSVVKQAQRDPRGACAGWEGMNRTTPGSASIVFNLGLCAEQRGDYDQALALYQDAYRLIGGDGDEARVGVDRARRLIAGREDARERARLRRG